MYFKNELQRSAFREIEKDINSMVSQMKTAMKINIA